MEKVLLTTGGTKDPWELVPKNRKPPVGANHWGQMGENMESCVFIYPKTEKDERLKAIVVWPGDDLGAPPTILPLGGTFEKDEEIRKRLEKALRQ